MKSQPFVYILTSQKLSKFDVFAKIWYNKLVAHKKQASERMLKMDNNSNSALKINQVISVFTVLVILGTSIQLFNFKPNNVQIAVQNNIQEETKVAQSYERDVKITTRSEVNRGLQTSKPAEAVIKYKTIEEI